MRPSEGVALGLEVFGSGELTVSSTASSLGGGGSVEVEGPLAAGAPSDAEGL